MKQTVYTLFTQYLHHFTYSSDLLSSLSSVFPSLIRHHEPTFKVTDCGDFTTLVAMSLAADPFETAIMNNPLVCNFSDIELALRARRGLRQEVSNSMCSAKVCFTGQGYDFIIPIDFSNQKNS